ncbi:MAG: SUMF1/EgtB/PvdO family nonheme iron enzyme [Acidobacteriota bacterium]
MRTVWFNAWKYPSEEKVLAGLLGALYDAIGRGDWTDQAKLALAENKEWLASVLLDGLQAGLSGVLLKGGKQPSSSERVAEGRAFHDTFRELFLYFSYVWSFKSAAGEDLGHRDLEKQWREKQDEAAIAVFLDDLDRCKEERIIEVLEAINLFLDLPGVCFYLGVAWDRLKDALPKAVAGHEEEFLDKIVQVAFDLPEVNERQAAEYVSDLVDGSPLVEHLRVTVGDDVSDVEAIARVLDHRHPRTLKRFLNDLSIRIAVLQNTVIEQQTRRDAGEKGDPPVVVTPQAVVAWHLLLASLSEERRTWVRAGLGNLEQLLLEWRRREEPSESSGDDPLREEVVALRARDGLGPYLEELDGLDLAQRNVLLHHGSPTRDESPSRSSRQRAALGDLQGLDEPESDAWVTIPAGSFWMGAEEKDEAERPRHEVSLSEYRLARHPVTNAQYAVYVAETGKGVPSHWEDGRSLESKEEHPVTHVSWHDAVAFATWLGKRTESAGAFRLPTEAQWERAAKGPGGGERRHPWGDDAPNRELANFGGGVGDTTPVGTYPKGASAEGALDLAGNVWEWCHDWQATYPSGDRESDPTGPERGDRRVLRGGSFNGHPNYLRSAFRHAYPPEGTGGLVGFRLAWSFP